MTKLFIFLVLSIILAGCKANFGTVPEKSAKREFLKGAVVKDFPGVPLYPKAKILESYGYKNSYGAAFVSGEKLDKVIKFYQQGLGQLGWESTLRRRSDTNFVFSIKNQKYAGELIVNVAADGKRTAITTYLSQR